MEGLESLMGFLTKVFIGVAVLKLFTLYYQSEQGSTQVVESNHSVEIQIKKGSL